MRNLPLSLKWQEIVTKDFGSIAILAGIAGLASDWERGTGGVQYSVSLTFFVKWADLASPPCNEIAWMADCALNDAKSAVFLGLED